MVLERGLGVATDINRRNADGFVGGIGVPVRVIGGLVRLVAAARSIEILLLSCLVIVPVQHSASDLGGRRAAARLRHGA